MRFLGPSCSFHLARVVEQQIEITRLENHFDEWMQRLSA